MTIRFSHTENMGVIKFDNANNTNLRSIASRLSEYNRTSHIQLWYTLIDDELIIFGSKESCKRFMAENSIVANRSITNLTARKTLENPEEVINTTSNGKYAKTARYRAALSFQIGSSFAISHDTRGKLAYHWKNRFNTNSK